MGVYDYLVGIFPYFPIFSHIFPYFLWYLYPSYGCSPNVLKGSATSHSQGSVQPSRRFRRFRRARQREQRHGGGLWGLSTIRWGGFFDNHLQDDWWVVWNMAFIFPCIYIYVYIYIHNYICLYIYNCVYIYNCIYIYMSIYTVYIGKFIIPTDEIEFFFFQRGRLKPPTRWYLSMIFVGLFDFPWTSSIYNQHKACELGVVLKPT